MCSADNPCSGREPLHRHPGDSILVVIVDYLLPEDAVIARLVVGVLLRCLAEDVEISPLVKTIAVSAIMTGAIVIVPEAQMIETVR